MCLAEALLRIPDRATRDALIRDKISKGDWKSHMGQAPSLFVNAATWGLMITGKLVTTNSEAGLSSALTRLIGTRRRTADPQGRRHGDAPDGRAVRHRRDDLRSAREQPQVRSARLPLLLRHARRSRDDRRRRAALLRVVRAGDPRDRQGGGRARHLRRPGHFDQALRAASALLALAAGTHDERTAAARALARAYSRAATTSA